MGKPPSGMVGRFVEEGCSKQLLACRLCAAALRFDRDENLIDLSQHVRIFELEHPAILSRFIDIQNAEAARRLRTAFPLAPYLEVNSAHIASVLQVVRIKDQRLALGIKNTAGKRADPSRSCVILHVDDP